jgi:drug/metabolite transporter (DMT)-like permease
VAVAFALASALCYGVSDYLAGVTSRAWDSRVVTAIAQFIGLVTAVVAVLLFPGDGPAMAPAAWGALSGIGSAIGVLALYQGLAVGSMNVVAPLCGVLTCVIPAVIGVLLGDQLTAVELAGITLAVPAVALVSRQQRPASGPRRTGGAPLGLLAGAGFGLLFVALDQAGTQHGAWPLLPGQAVSLLLVLPFTRHGLRTAARPGARTLATTAVAGILSGGANLLYLVATRYGELAIVGVVSSLYPAGTVLIARFRLAERWSRVQVTGMITAVVAVIFVVIG